MNLTKFLLIFTGARSRRRNPPKMKKAKLIHSANSNLVPILPKPPVPQTPYRYPGSQYPGSNYHFAGQFHSGPDVNLNNNHPPAENESEVSRSISRPPNNSHEGESSGSGYITEKWWDQKWNHWKKKKINNYKSWMSLHNLISFIYKNVNKKRICNDESQKIT